MRPKVGVVQFQAVCPQGDEHALGCGITYELARRFASLGGMDANAILLGNSPRHQAGALGLSFDGTFDDSDSIEMGSTWATPNLREHDESDFIVVGHVHIGDGLNFTYRFYEVESGRLVREGVISGLRTAVFRLLDDLAHECRIAMGYFSEEPHDFEADLDFDEVPDSMDFDAFANYCIGREAEHPGKALAGFERALTHEPGFRHALVEYLSVCYQVEETAKAMTLIDQYLRLVPNDHEILIGGANLCLGFNRVEEGLAYAARAVELHPEEVESRVLMARFLFASEMPQAASEQLARALNSADQSPEASYCLGRYYLDLGDVYRARGYFETCMDTDPNYLVALRDLQCCYYELGDFTEGIHACESLLDIDPSDPGSNFNLGLIYQRLGRMHLAVKYFEEVVIHDPSFAKAYFMIGDYELQRDRVRAALARFEDARRSAPESVEVLGKLGDCHFRLGKLREAYRHYSQARKAEPLFENARFELIEGMTLVAEGTYEAGRQHLAKAVHLEADFAEAHSELAWALLLEGKPERAWQSIRRAVELEPDNPVYLANLLSVARRLPLGMRISSEPRSLARNAKERLRVLAEQGVVCPEEGRRQLRRRFVRLTWCAVRG